MRVTFIPASELKQQYSVFGHFYALHAPSVAPLKCRSILEITSKDAQSNPIADAVFVMMNPGRSKPVAEMDHIVDAEKISEMTAQLEPTVPDTTQYQVMRIMHHAGWQHVRVINLSDLRDPQSDSFAERYVQWEKQTGSKVHSVFSSQRSAELRRHLSGRHKGSIVFAWGVSDDLNPLIERATAALAVEQTATGLVKPGQPGKYFHPLPRLQCQKEQWVIRMLDQLTA